MAEAPSSTKRLTRFYEEMSSLDGILKTLAENGVDTDHLRASDIYRRDLDCQNLGAHSMLDVIAGAVVEYGTPRLKDRVLDIGCGLGGPGRYLVERFGWTVVGVDLLPLRIKIARALTQKTDLSAFISYRVADATALPFKDRTFMQAWMLDVSIHIKDKRGLFTEIARVLRPGGLLVMHDQLGPLPKAMLPVTRRAPYLAPSLPQLVRLIDGSGLRVLTWRDTTGRVLEHFRQLKAKHRKQPAPLPGTKGRRWRERRLAALDAYIETLGHHGGRTGILIAKRVG